MDQLRDQGNLRPQLIQNEIKRKYGLEVSRYKIHRGKKRAKDMIYGDSRAQFEILRDYCQTLLDHNPGSSIGITTDPSLNPLRPRFERLFVCLEAWKSGFVNGCRPFIGLDGCHMKGVDGGQMLSAIGRDGNNGMFPIAIAWVEAENKDSWKWFIDLVMQQVGRDRPWTIMSD